MYDRVNKFSSYFTWIMVVMMFCGMILYNVIPLYNNYKNGVFSNNMKENYSIQFSVYYAFPNFNQEDHVILTSCLNCWFSYVVSGYVCLNDILLCLMIIQVIGHVAILKSNLENFPRPEKLAINENISQPHCNIIDVDCDLFDARENEMISAKIKECVNHHRLIISFITDVSEFYGPMIGTTYMYHLFICCLLLLECSALNMAALVRYGPLTLIIFGQLVQLSVIFGVVATKIDELSNAVYGLPWESMNTRNQRTVCILLHRTQMPSHIIALGMTKVGVQTMLGILKTTFSYFAFLQTLD